MADDKRNDQIVDSSELSEQDLEKATGGVAMPAAVDRAEASRATFSQESSHHRK